MFSRKFKIIILIAAITFSLSIMLFFVIKNFATSRNLSEVVKDYDVKIENMDNKEENLNADIVANAIEIKELNKSITISLDKISTSLDSQPQIVYRVQFNENLFQYIFLKLIIRTFPQWETNNFIFHFNLLNNAVWVQYNTNLKADYLQWYFKIVSKI